MPLLDSFMTQKAYFWARLRRNYCNNHFDYTDYWLVTYSYRTLICHPITITHDNYFNYSNYCLKRIDFRCTVAAFYDYAYYYCNYIDYFKITYLVFAVIASQTRPKIGFWLLRIIITPITLIILVIVSISSIVRISSGSQDLLTRGGLTGFFYQLQH